ncbi:MAG: MarR family transcriptional regulator [Clostridia bacterium]|nr:MarR family transcriptional regulator [Clostridia bacterium]
MPTIMRKISVISRCANLYRAENSTLKIHGGYHSYITAICKYPGSSQDFLAKYLCKNKSSVTRHLTFLENEGFISRKVSAEDKREMLVYPTQKMKDILPETYEIARKWNSLLTADIDEEELEIFNNVLDKMFLTAKKTIYGKGEKK